MDTGLTYRKTWSSWQAGQQDTKLEDLVRMDQVIEHDNQRATSCATRRSA